MNTTAKGNILENLVYNLLQERVDQKIHGQYVKLHKHKKYTSKIEDRTVDVDVSIDCYLSEEDMTNDEPFRSIFYECKNYEDILNIGQYDEFKGKLAMFPGTKGCLVSSSGFSESTIKSAPKIGIALIRASIEEKKLDYIVKRSIHDYTLSYRLLRDLQGEESVQKIVIYNDGLFVSIDELLESSNIPIKKKNIVIPYLESEDIENRVNLLCPKTNMSNDILADIVNNQKDFTLYNDNMPDEMLGYFDVINCEIHINNKLGIGSPRFRFTLAHELGHYYLHYKFLHNDITILGDTESSIYDIKENNFVKRIEYQANLFASYLLMPTIQFKIEVQKLFKQYGINRGRLYVDDQECNQWNYHVIVGKISEKFGVSKKAVEIRMKNLCLLEINN